MNQVQNSLISLSPPTKKQYQYFPAINFKTTESPQKGSFAQPNYLFSQHLQNKINNRKLLKNKEIMLDKAYSIRKYLQVNSLYQRNSNMSESKILQNTSITQNKDTSLEIKQSLSPQKRLNKIDETFNTIGFQDINLSLPKNNFKQPNQSSIQHNLILELDQGKEKQDQKKHVRDQDLMIISSLFQKNSIENSETKQSKSQSPNKLHNALKVTLQNKEYKKYASQMIRMIRNTQQSLMQEFDQEQLELEKEYKQKKVERQKERKEALQTAQEGIKNRQLKSMLIALKGTQDKIMFESPLYLNIGKKLNLQNSQTALQSRKSSFQQIYQQQSIDKQFDDRNIMKNSNKSDLFSLETSLETPLQISKFI